MHDERQVVSNLAPTQEALSAVSFFNSDTAISMCILQAILIVYSYTMHLKVYEMFLVPVAIQVVLHWPFIIYEIQAEGRSGDANFKRMLVHHVALGYTG